MAESTKAAKATPDEDAPAKFTVEELLPHARRVAGCSRHVLAGALADVTGKITQEEARKKADAFCKREVESR
jgi:hypothetical protein